MAKGIYKTIENLVPHWFRFGEHPDGKTDVSDGNKDIVSGIDKKEMESLISDRDKLIMTITTLSEELITHTSFEHVDKILEEGMR